MRLVRLTAAMLAIGAAPMALAAQVDPPADPAQGGAPAVDGDAAPEAEGEEIVVTGRALPGAVPGDIAPELQLSPADIRAYGVSSVSELLEELAPQLRSGRGRDAGRPVVLINGRRSAGFQEVRDLPPEAILRVDILPEEAALKFGFRADQRVINFVLRPRFRSYTGELDARVPTEGGSSQLEAEAGLVRIDRDRRVTLDLEAETRSNLLESERGIIAGAAGRPFDLIGNVTAPVIGDEIDPALSAAAGTIVTVAPVPIGDVTLPGFAAGANVARVTDTTPFRTLQAAQDRYSANAVYSRTLFDNVSATATGRLERIESQSLLGLPGVTLSVPGTSPFSPFAGDVALYRSIDGNALVRDARSWTGAAAVALNGDIGRWRWSLNGNYDREESETLTERGVDSADLQAGVSAGTIDPFGAIGPFDRLTDRARSVSSIAEIDALASGTLFALPAGDVATSLRVLGRTTDFDSRSIRSGLEQEAAIGRDQATVRANIDLPIASSSRAVLPALGRLSANANAEIDRLSDFGTLTTIGYGLNWQPIEQVRLLVSVTHEEGAPTPQQLGNPTILTPFVRVFDFVRGETVDITRIDGGNTVLTGDSRRVVKLGLNVRPIRDTDLTLNADYVASRIDDPVASFPAATAEIEAAFPERFVRDGDGRLLQLDNRPVNFAENRRSELRWGVNFSKPVTTARSRAAQAAAAARRAERETARERGEAPAAGGRGPGGGPGGRGPGGFGGGGRGGFGGGGGGRLQASLYHTWRLEETIVIRAGLPELDLLNGSAIGNNGGQPRHELEFRGGYTADGIGARLNVDWRQSTRVDGGLVGGDTLDFGSLTTVNLRLFADLGQQPSLVRSRPWLRGTRVTLGVDNLFNQRQRVTDADGVVPLNFQPGFVDPLGRSVRVSVRKLLF